MSEPRNIQDILAEAERSASTGDFLSAEGFLREAARRQEAELGPVHPDLANTVNNLAVVAEKGGRLDAAEAFYRRAAAIASASLPPDDPRVAASRQNLEDFCRATGRPIVRPPIIEPPAAAPAPAPPIPSPPAPPAAPAVASQTSRARATQLIGAVGLIIAALFMAWLWALSHPSRAVPAARPSPAKTAQAAPSAPSTVAPLARKPAPNVARTPAAAPSSGTQLATVRLCRSFSTDDFRCVPAGDSVLAGPVVLYTQVRSPSDGVIVHRWFRGDALRKSARLSIKANRAEGYRTYSRQSVDRGDWRVEVRSAAGELLYEHRLIVR